jgi:type II secretory pathway component PulF
MNTYKCIIADAEGNIFTVYRDGSSEQEIIREFAEKKYTPIKISTATNENKSPSRRKNEKTVLEFTQMMELLVDSGLSVKDSLEVASLIGGKNKKGKLAADLLSDIHKGNSFATSVNNMTTVFSPIYRGIISVGDIIGSVEKIFPRLRMYLENQKKIREKISGALIYPCMVLCVALFGLTGLSVFVIPRLEAIFRDFGGEAAIQLQSNMQRLQHGLISIAISIVILILLGIGIHQTAKRNIRLRQDLDRLKLYVPVIGRFLTAWQTLNFTFAMETLTAGGITVETAISKAKAVVSNEAYKAALEKVSEDIEKGTPLSEAFSKHKEFPEYMSQWLIVGERSGKTEQVFSQIRTYFQNETERLIARFMILIEPTFIILIGLLLLFMVIAIIVPLFSLYGSIL